MLAIDSACAFVDVCVLLLQATTTTQIHYNVLYIVSTRKYKKKRKLLFNLFSGFVVSFVALRFAFSILYTVLGKFKNKIIYHCYLFFTYVRAYKYIYIL